MRAEHCRKKGRHTVGEFNQLYFNSLVKASYQKTPYRCSYRLSLSAQASRSCAGPNIKVLKDKDLEFANSIPPFFETSAGSTFESLVHREKKAGFFEEPHHPAMYLLDTRWKPMHNAMRVREGTVTITGSHPHSRWSLCAQGHSILSQYQALYPAILDIATYLSLNKLFGSESCVQLLQ